MASGAGDTPPAELVWSASIEPARPYPHAIRVTVDRAGRSLAWYAGWESGPHIHVVDTATGNEWHRVTCAATRVLAAGSGFFAVDHGWRPDRRGTDREPLRLLCLVPGAGRAGEAWLELAPATSLLGVEPAGDRLLLFGEGHTLLCTWPDSIELAAWDGYETGVDWASACLWRRRRQAEPYVISALDGSWERPVAGSERSWPLERVGDGVLRLGWHGIRLLAPHGDPLTVVAPTARSIYTLQVIGRRTVNVVLGGRPRRFTVDLDTPRVVAAPPDAHHLVRLTTEPREPPVWHPTAELVALGHRRGRTLVMTTTGVPVCRLPDRSIPLAWLPQDHSLILATASLRLERWHVPTAAPCTPGRIATADRPQH
jgi:hypothetical protein